MKKHIIALSTTIVLCGLNQDGLGVEINVNGKLYDNDACKAGYVYRKSIVVRQGGTWYCQKNPGSNDYWRVTVSNPMPTGTMETVNYYNKWDDVKATLNKQSWYYPPQKRFLGVENCNRYLSYMLGGRSTIKCDITSTEE